MYGIGRDLGLAIRNLIKVRGLSTAAILAYALGTRRRHGGGHRRLRRAAEAAPLSRGGSVGRRLRDPIRGRGANASKSLRRSFVSWRDDACAFDDAAALSSLRYRLTGLQEPIEVRVNRVTANFFRVLGVDPFMGRPFEIEEQQPGRARQSSSAIPSGARASLQIRGSSAKCCCWKESPTRSSALHHPGWSHSRRPICGSLWLWIPGAAARPTS